MIDKIGRALQAKITFDEIKAFLAEFKIDPPPFIGMGSKWVYSKTALRGVQTDTLRRRRATLRRVDGAKCCADEWLRRRNRPLRTALGTIDKVWSKGSIHDRDAI